MANASQVPIMWMPSSMLLQILAACPAPEAAGMDHCLAHFRQQQLGAGEGRVRAADHESQRAGIGRGDAARDRRIDHVVARCHSPPRPRPSR